MTKSLILLLCVVPWVVLLCVGMAGYTLLRPRSAAVRKGGVKITLRAKPAAGGAESPAGRAESPAAGGAASPAGGGTLSPAVLEGCRKVVQQRVDARVGAEGFVPSDVVVRVEGSDAIIVEAAGVPLSKGLEWAKELAREGMLRFVKIPDKYLVSGSGDTTIFFDKGMAQEVPPVQVLTEAERAGGVIVTGRELLPNCRADVGRDGSSIVYLKFNADGRRKFADFTLRNVKKYFGIFLDETPISVPIVEEPIPGGDGIIHGGFNLKEAQEMKDLLNAGAMPARLDVEQVVAVGPSR